jgi:hypothetical protein
MFGRRRRARSEDATSTGPEGTEAQAADAAGEPGSVPESASGDLPQGPRPDGPFDADEVDLDQAREGRADLGGMLVPAQAGMKLQLQVDEKSGRATSVMAMTGDAAVQLIAVAAPRSSGMWEQTRLQVAEDAKRRGGKAEEASGPFGTEVRILLPVTTADGKKAVQPSRIAGIDGPRWMLRATFLGGATSDAAVFASMVEFVKGVVVVRGDRPMPPGDVIALTPPQTPSQDVEGEPTS